MGDGSRIEWTDATWNPVTGCSKVSPGCAHCYAEAVSLRFKRSELPWTPANAAANVVLHPKRLNQPLRWTRPRMVFVNSMSDLFHELVPDEYIAAVFGVMAAAPQHTFQVLTKRPERMRAFAWHAAEVAARDLDWERWRVCEDAAVDHIPDLPAAGCMQPWPLPNVWLGVSIENRRYVDRADLLRATPAAVRFISAEPLLGPLLPDADHLVDADGDLWDVGNAPVQAWRPWADGYTGPGLNLEEIDWLIVGGESGPRHRPMDPQWARDLRDYCQTECWQGEREGSTAFFLKQLGGSRPGDALEALPEDLRIREMPEPVAAA